MIMKKLFMLTISVALLWNTAFAGEVKIYSRPVPAKELGAQLFPEPNKTRTRSINFAGNQAEATDLLEVEDDPAHLGLLINFAYNSAEILPESEEFIDEVGRMLNLEEYSQQKLVIEGHTDAAGSERYNYFLSEKRAQSVKHFLITHYQISESRLLTKGQGERKLLSDRSPYNAANRRVEFFKAP